MKRGHPNECPTAEALEHADPHAPELSQGSRTEPEVDLPRIVRLPTEARDRAHTLHERPRSSRTLRLVGGAEITGSPDEVCVGAMVYRIARASSYLRPPVSSEHEQRVWYELLDLLMRVGLGLRFRITAWLADGQEVLRTALTVAAEEPTWTLVTKRLGTLHERLRPWLDVHRDLALFADDPGFEGDLEQLTRNAHDAIELAPRERASPWALVPWLGTRHEARRLSDSLRAAGRGIAVSLLLRPVDLAPNELAYLSDETSIGDPLDPRRFNRRLFLTSTRAALHDVTVQALGAALVGLPGRTGGMPRSADGFESLRPACAEKRDALLAALDRCDAPPLFSRAPHGLNGLRAVASPAEIARIMPARDLGPMDAPAAPAGLQPGTGARLGRVAFGGRPAYVRMSDEDAAHHAYVLGASGRGKSTLLLNLALERAIEGHGLALLDPHGDLADDFLHALPSEHLGRVLLIDPTDTEFPVGLNPLTHDHRVPGASSFVINELFRIFESLWDMRLVSGPLFEQYFRNALRIILRALPGRADLLHLTRVFADDDFRGALLATATDPLAATFWNGIAEPARGEASLAAMAPYITSKIDVLMADDVLMPMLLQVEKCVDFDACMERRDLVLIRLEKGRLGGVGTRLLGMILVMRILAAALARGARSRAARLPFHVFIDETQNFLTPSLAELIAEARKFGVRLTLANQNLSQIPSTLADSLLGNAATLVVCGVGDGDAGRLAATMGDASLAPQLARLGGFRAVVRPRLDAKLHAPFEVDLLPPPPVWKGADLGARLGVVRARSRTELATERRAVLDALRSRHGLCA